MHKAIVVGAGRIGAGFNWNDDAYTHAGAYQALKDRVQLVGFVEPDKARAEAAWIKWGVKAFNDLDAALSLEPDIVSVCVQPEQQASIMERLGSVKGIWCEKPFVAIPPPVGPRVQVNYLRRADPLHRSLALMPEKRRLIVYAKDDIHTRCHFEDLALWWNVPYEYRKFDGPCSYILETERGPYFFDTGGVAPWICMRGMLWNLLDAVEGKAELWSPPY